MNNDAWQVIAVAVATLAQVYVTEPDSIKLAMARIWHHLAWILGMIANALAKWSMVARLHYFEVINDVV